MILGFPLRLKIVWLLFLIQLFTVNARRTNNLVRKGQRRQSINIGEFPGQTGNRRQGRPSQDGDIYEFHRFQHYGFKTPAPNTLSLESMLAFLAPLATIPIIASAALSSMAAILPSLTTEGMVKGRSRREAVAHLLDPSNNFTLPIQFVEDSNRTIIRNSRDFDIIHKYLKQMNPQEDYNDEVMASYLQCNGMLSSNNHCLERLVCQFSDASSRMESLQKDVASLIIYTIMNNKFIKVDFKERLRNAAFFGRDKNGQCGLYYCSRRDYRPV